MLREFLAAATLILMLMQSLPAERAVLSPERLVTSEIITREAADPLSSGRSSAPSRAEVLPNASSAPAAYTDQQTYVPGSTVTFRGDGAAAEAYQPGEPISVQVQGPAGRSAGCTARADTTGNWQCQILLDASPDAFGLYAFSASGARSKRTDSGTFTCAASWYETRLSEPVPSAAVAGAPFVSSTVLHIDLCSCYRCGEGAYCTSCRRDALNASGYLIRLETGTFAQWAQTGAGGIAEAVLFAPRYDGWLAAEFLGTDSLPPAGSRRELSVLHPLRQEDSVAELPK